MSQQGRLIRNMGGPVALYRSGEKEPYAHADTLDEALRIEQADKAAAADQAHILCPGCTAASCECRP